MWARAHGSCVWCRWQHRCLDLARYERDSAFMDEIPTDDEKRIFAFDGDSPAVVDMREELLQVRVHTTPRSSCVGDQ